MSPFVSVGYNGGGLFTDTVCGNIARALCRSVRAKRGTFFRAAARGVGFLPRLFARGFVYGFVSYRCLPSFVGERVLSRSSHGTCSGVIFRSNYNVVGCDC